MTTPAKVKVWDPFIRIFHWTLVSAFLITYLTEDELLDLHVWAGYIILLLIFLRVLWGLLGTRYARFTDFVYNPKVIKQYLFDTIRLRAPRYLGHNPAGGAMIILLLMMLLLTSLSGLMVYGVEDGAGPFAGLVINSNEFWAEIFEETHEFFANLTVFLVLLHVGGVIFQSLIHSENLVKAMWNGYKRRPD